MRKLFTLVFAISLFLYAPIQAQNGGMHIKGPAKPILKTGTYLIINGDLKVSITDGLIIKPSTYVTVKGDMSLDARKAITVQTSIPPDTTRGSLIFNGDTVYRSNKGSIEVQSYITGSAGTNYFMHFVGAPVEDTTTGWTRKVRLQQFDMTHLDTFAFEWDPTVDTTTGQPWINVYPYWYPVPAADGLTLSNYEAGSDTIIMEGYPIAGTVSYTVHYNTNNHLELISNPFPSAMDFSSFATDNSTYIQNKYWIYSATDGNYYPNSNGTGGSQYIQYGQGFFVETKTNGSINFRTNDKVHNNVAFRETNPNELTMRVSGGTIGFKDALYIRFMEEGASSGIDDLDAKKWNSVSAGATMIRSIAADGAELAINMMPIEDLYTNTTVPVYFECGEEAEYTFTFEGTDSFEDDSEIWLEDLQAGTDWISLSDDNFSYAFTASPGDAKHRFNIHFFGPTSVTDPFTDEDGRILIYSAGNNAYVINNSKEIIKNVTVYNMLGHQILSREVPAQVTNKFRVPGQTGYYVVRVLTDKQVHTGKILILK
jgi:hypothetical protein